jgi:hypothetical protein
LTLRDRHGLVVVRYTGLTAHDASGRELVAWLELSRHQLRLRVEDAGAHYPVVVDPFIQVARLHASDAAENDGLVRGRKQRRQHHRGWRDRCHDQHQLFRGRRIRLC